MRLIDADNLNRVVISNNYLKEDETDTEFVERLLKLIDDQPTVYPIFSSRSNGKQAITNYINMCKVLDNFGIDSTNPVDSLVITLENYQKILMQLTGGVMSKLTYDPDTILAYIYDRFNSEENTDTNKAYWVKHINHRYDYDREQGDLVAGIYYTCSECGKVGYPTANFCSGCGAEMLGVSKDVKEAH